MAPRRLAPLRVTIRPLRPPIGNRFPPPTIDDSLSVVVRGTGYADAEWRHIDELVSIAIGAFSRMPREGVKKEQRCFTDEEVGRIIAAAPEPFSTILAITSVLGLRIGEILALRVSGLDFARRIVRVRQSVDAATRNAERASSEV